MNNDIICNPTQSQRIYSEMLWDDLENINTCQSNLNVRFLLASKYPGDDSIPYFKIVLYKTYQAIASLSLVNPNDILWGNVNQLSQLETNQIKKFVILNQEVLLKYYFNALCNPDYDVMVDFYPKLKPLDF